MTLPKPGIHRLGTQGEKLAVKALKRAGYKILDRNVHLGRYELDIIAQEDGSIVFVEVKTRRTDNVVEPGDNVGPAKQRHIVNAAKRYIADRDDPALYYRFDVVSIVIPEKGKPEIAIYRDAFQA